VAVILVFRTDSRETARSERHPVGGILLAGTMIGILSALVGIGGGVMLVPFLTMVLGYPPRRAVGTSGAVIPLIALFGAAGYVVHGWGIKGLMPYSAGYVDLFFVLCVSTTSMLVAPLGARIGMRLHVKWLNRLFALLLVFVALKMFGIY
ncbi:MAG: sulfite exporter TauE/SafE family protein, partial [Syntrophales bacterium]|nr:sulfite exporter TauE/SafE family protein [Syntrophales bacterium]